MNRHFLLGLSLAAVLLIVLGVAGLVQARSTCTKGIEVTISPSGGSVNQVNADPRWFCKLGR